MNDEIERPTKDPLAQSEPSAIKWGQLGWGVAILTVGVLRFSGELDLIDFDFDDAWRYMPLILIAFGLVGIGRGKTVKHRDDGWWLLVIGIYLQVNFLELWGFDWRNSWPLILILVGVAKLLDPRTSAERESSFWYLGIGAFFLLAQDRFFGLEFDDAWPVLLILVGMALTWSALHRNGRSSKAGAK